MHNYLKYDVLLLRYPFADLSDSKIRPAVLISTQHISEDIFVVPLTSRTTSFLSGEFVLDKWNVGKLFSSDAKRLEDSLRNWLGLH
ncbi:MAG: MazF family transcriptional regulator [Bacteroidota bacterium]|nr:MazF family transcriptional regulator [Bacteroidota bacterium]